MTLLRNPFLFVLGLLLSTVYAAAEDPNSPTSGAQVDDPPPVVVTTTSVSDDESTPGTLPRIGSCIGHRSTYIDREYCQALEFYAPCVSGDDCHDALTLTSCTDTCAEAGCECKFVPGDNCTDTEQSCGMLTCLVLEEEPAYVGSCVFFTSLEACESVTGCTWATPNVVATVAVSESSSSSSVSGVGILITVLVGLFGLALLAAFAFLIYWFACKTNEKRTLATTPESTPSTGFPKEEKENDIPVASAIAEDPTETDDQDLKA